jgi:hypothetical protein
MPINIPGGESDFTLVQRVLGTDPTGVGFAFDPFLVNLGDTFEIHASAFTPLGATTWSVNQTLPSNTSIVNYAAEEAIDYRLNVYSDAASLQLLCSGTVAAFPQSGVSPLGQIAGFGALIALILPDILTFNVQFNCANTIFFEGYIARIGSP